MTISAKRNSVGPNFKKANLQAIGGGKRQERAQVVSAKEHQHYQQLQPRLFRQDKRVTNDHGAHEEIIEQVIHVVAPAHEAGVSIFADLPVVIVGDILKENHEGNHPQPADVCRRKIAKTHNQERPNEREHGEMMSFQPLRYPWQHMRRQAALERCKK